MVAVFKILREKGTRIAAQVIIVALIFASNADAIDSAKPEKILTKNLPLVFEPTFPGNHKWLKPANILDDDDSTWSLPSRSDYSDSDGSYYNLYLKRPVTNSGSLVDPTDYGRILKVQVRISYGIREGYKLSRYSYLEYEGLVNRLENVEIKGAGVDERFVELIDVTQAVKNWSFSNPEIWDEIVVRFGCEEDDLGEMIFRLYGLTLAVTYIPK